MSYEVCSTLRSMKTKVCSTCKRRRKVKFFTRNASKKDGLNYSCGECQRAYTRAHYTSNKEYYASKSEDHRKKMQALVRGLKDVPCSDCGVRYPHYVMDFDHVRGRKTKQVADMVSRSMSERAIRKEAEKCDVVCANCHRERTHG